MSGPLVAPEALLRQVADPDLRLVDFRWYLDGRSGHAAYLGGHLPGAVFVDLEAITGATGPGRHPLPDAGEFVAAMRRAGVSNRSRVVVYDDQSGAVAARLWWLLRHHGHAAVAVLDGGVQAWPGSLETGEVEVAAGDFTPGAPLDGGVVDLEMVRRPEAGSVVLDSRLGERYRGEVEPIDPRAGHIPGALSAPLAGNLGPDGRLLPAAALRERFGALGVTSGEQAIVYCGSGVNACANLLALEVAGLAGGRLYAGSWSDWSRHRELPAATGPRP